MAKKPSLAYSILTLRCPKCREGKLFSNPNFYNLKTISKMPEKCPVCSLEFNPEPGFYWGAMYVSYAISVGISLITFLIMYLIWGWLTWQFIITNAIILLALIPLTFRYARCIYLYIVLAFESNSKPTP
ncbi:MAG: DUF983 domain-containing protein [Bacteroidota bacterium]